MWIYQTLKCKDVLNGMDVVLNNIYSDNLFIETVAFHYIINYICNVFFMVLDY